MGNDAENIFHAGRLVARRLKASGIDTVFTLSGGHLFSIYDGCRSEGIRLIDTRHEQTAAFAAEGWSKVTRQPGVAALTAGPGVTNGMSAMAAAQQNSSPLLVLGGRAPAGRWGMGSLQEIDHIPFVSPLTRFAATAPSPEAVCGLIDEALCATVGAPSGVAFIDFPMDHVFSVAADDGQPGALTTLDSIKDLAATTQLEVGEQILATRFAEPHTSDADGVKVPNNMQLLTVALDLPHAAGGKLQPGDKVGAYVTVDGKNQLVLPSILVVTSTSDTVTLALPPKDVQKVMLGTQANLWLVVSSKDSASTSPMTVKQILE